MLPPRGTRVSASALALLLWVALPSEGTAQTIPSSGLSLWVSADQGITTDGSGNVSAWDDRSASNNDLLQATAGARPLFVSSGFNGLPVLRFDGTDDFLLFTTRLTNVRSVFWVVKESSSAPVNSGRFILGDVSNWDFHAGANLWESTYAHPSIREGVTRFNGDVIDGTATDRPKTMSVISLITTGNVSADAFSRDRSYGRHWWGDLAELIIYDRAVTPAERTQIEGYLLAKYEIGPVVAPAISPAGGLFTTSATVTMSTPTAGASIRVTTDGTEPTESSSLYSEPLAVTDTQTIKAKAFKTGLTPSATATAGFTDSAEFHPGTLTGLKLWWRGDAGVFGGWGDTWTDQSGNGNHATQATGTAIPRLVPDALNGLPVMRFDGTTDFLRFTTRLTNVQTVFWVIKEDSAAPTASGRFMLGDVASYDFHAGDTSIWEPSYSSGYIRAGETRINGSVVNGTAVNRPREWAVMSLVTTGNVAADSFSKDRSYPWRYWWGDLAELIIYDRALSGGDRQAIADYLQSKYLSPTLSAPYLSPGAGTYSSGQSVTMTASGGASIRYTLDGSEPTLSSTLYSGPVTVDQPVTIKAKAWAGSLQSTVATGAYAFVAPTPSLSVAGGTYTTPQSVTVTCALGSAAMHYTTNGVDPTESDPVITSGTSLTVDLPLTLKVRAWWAGWTPSAQASATYSFQVATPTLTPAGGTFSGVLPVTISTTSPGATLRYRLDGGEPTETDSTITSGSALNVDRSGTVKVRGWRTGWTTSASAQDTYWINLGTAATPTLSPAPGTFTSSQSVSISTTTSGALIRYTTDGTEPTFESPIYTSAISVGVTTVVKARACAAEMAGSASAGGLYRIDLGTVDPPRFSPGAGSYSTY
jgi:hypothetical protein